MKILLKKYIFNIYKFCLPLFHIVFVSLLIYYIQHFRYIEKNFPLFTYFLFLPILVSEFYVTKFFEGNGKFKKDLMIPFITRCLIWIIFYCIYVEIPKRLKPNGGDQIAMGAIFTLPINMKLVLFYARLNFTLIASVIILLLNYFIVFKHKKLRVTIVLFLPILLSWIIFNCFYFDLYGGVSEKNVKSQKGVEIFFSSKQFYKKGIFSLDRSSDFWRFPRALYIDKKRDKIYATYGNTFGKFGTSRFLQIDINTKSFKSLDIGVIRSFNLANDNNDKIYLAGFRKDNILYEISKDKFQISKKINTGNLVPRFNPVDIYENSDNKSILIINDIYPAVIKYDIKNKKVIKKLNFQELYPDTFCSLYAITYSKKLNKLYVASNLMEKSLEGLLVELDPNTLKIIRRTKIPVLSMFIDNKTTSLFATSPTTPNLWQINLNTLKIKKAYNIDPFCWSFFIDNDKNLIYVLSFLKGRLLVIDLKSGAILKKVLVGNNPRGMAITKRYLYVSSTLGIVRISINDLF